MVNLFNKKCLSTLLTFLSLSVVNSSLVAWDGNDCCNPCCEEPKCSRFYIGGFGGELFSDSTKMYQMGTAFFEEAVGGPLAIYATGSTKKTSSGFGGVQVGYETTIQNCCSDWAFAPAVELEAFFYSHKKSGHLINDTDPTRLPEHDFADSFKVNSSVVLVNAVLALNNSCWCGFSPYIGGGLGAARLSLKGADSLQVSPVEDGVNHFNSKRDDSTWAFAAQVKAGLRYKIWDNFHIFGEYRYLFIDSSNFILGSTVYPNHAPTSPWNVNIKNLNYNAFAIGIQFDL